MQFVFFFLVYVFYETECVGLKEEFTWTRINYAWSESDEPSEDIFAREAVDSQSFPESSPAAHGSGERTDDGINERDFGYIYENNIPMGANRWKDKYFITVPRRRFGIPSTLNFIWANSSNKHNVPLIPYPSWNFNRLNSTNKNRFVSVFRTAIDICDRMWFVDAGEVNSLGVSTRTQPPRIYVIDLNTDRIIRRYELKRGDLAGGKEGLASITVDVNPNDCNDSFAYIPDLGGFGLIVYDYAKDSSWRVNHNFFVLEPTAGDLEIAGIKFQWTDGVFSTALSKRDEDGFRTMYFHAMVGRHIYSVSTRILRNRELATRTYHGDDFKIVGDRGPGSHTSMTGLHESTGVLFLNLVNQNAVGCWNTNKEFKRENFDIIQKDDLEMIYPSDLKIAGDELIVLTNNMPLFVYSTLDYNDTNFRVWTAKVEEAIEGTTCSPTNKLPPTTGCQEEDRYNTHVFHALERLAKLFKF